MRYEAIREQTLARRKDWHCPADTQRQLVIRIGTPEYRKRPKASRSRVDVPPRPWDSLSRREADVRRLAEVYAGVIAHDDHHAAGCLEYWRSPASARTPW